MTSTAPALTDTTPHDWLDLLPPDWVPYGLRDALAAKEGALARTRAAEDDLISAESVLEILSADPDTPSYAPDLRTAALDVLVAREVLAVTPPAPEVPDHYAETIVTQITASFNPADVYLGSPPQCLTEQRHFAEMRHGPEVPLPERLNEERELLPRFAALAIKCHGMSSHLAAITGPLAGQPIQGRVATWHDFQPFWAEHVAEVAAMRAEVEQVNALRRESGLEHWCTAMQGYVRPLLEVELCPAPPWTLTNAQVDGRPSNVPADPATNPAMTS